MCQLSVLEVHVLHLCGQRHLARRRIAVRRTLNWGLCVSTLNTDCESRLRDLAQEFRVAARSLGWQSKRFRAYAETLDQIALELLIEEDGQTLRTQSFATTASSAMA